MKFLRIDLKAVGPFHNQSLDFSAGGPGFHLILGDNEAGKTSALRAISYLLFEFPAKGSDDFQHSLKDLRVGGVLRHSDGEELEIIRRRGNANTLRQGDDATVVAPDRLNRFLGGIDKFLFEHLFGIDHHRLKSAASEIRSGQGSLGPLLFSAGTGLAGLRQSQETLTKWLGDLYLPRGKNPKINQALGQLRDLRDELKTKQLSSDEWLHQDKARATARQNAAGLEVRLKSLRRDRDHLLRIRGAIPQVARWRKLREEIARSGDVVRLRDGFGDDCRRAIDEQHQSQARIDQGRAKILNHDAVLATIQPNLALLAAAETVESLNDRRGMIEKSDLDRKKLNKSVIEQDHKAKESCAKLGHPPDLEAAETRNLRGDEVAAIRSLSQQFTGLETLSDESAKAIRLLDKQLARLRRDRAELGEPRPVESFRRAISQAQTHREVDAEQSLANELCERLQADLELAIRRLPGWSGPLERLVALPVPLEPTLDRFESQMDAESRELALLDAKIASEDEAISRIELQRKTLDLSGNVPTEADLQVARRSRDAGWKLVRDTGLNAETSTKASKSFIAEFAPGQSLADAFEQSVRVSDDLADRLRREADQVALKAGWISQIEQHRQARENLVRTRQTAMNSRENCLASWSRLVDPLGLPEMTPSELRAWLRRRLEVVALAGQSTDAQRKSVALTQARDEHRGAIERALIDLNEPLPAAETTFRVCLEQAEAVLARIDADSLRRENLDRRIEQAVDEEDRARVRLENAEERLLAWRRDWGQLIKRLGYEQDVSPAQADEILTESQALQSGLARLRREREQIAAIDAEAARFAVDVAEVMARVLPGTEAQTAVVQARELARLLQDSRNLETRRNDLQRERDDEHEQVLAAEARLLQAKGQLDRLCREAGCQSPDELAAADRRSMDRSRGEAEIRECEQALFEAGSGPLIDDFAAMVEQYRVEDLDEKIANLDQELDATNAEISRENQAIGEANNALARMDGGDHSAESTERSQSVMARLVDDVTRFATLRLAAEVLQQSMDRYREKNQGVVIQEAGRIFGELTGNSFVRLVIDDENGTAVIKGVRADGKFVEVDGMSDGSHDQLYLALRLASLESWLQTHEPIPLIVDDILLNFDDHRSAAALRALAHLSAKTQILFFTHHRHLIELAKAHLPASVASYHELHAKSLIGS